MNSNNPPITSRPPATTAAIGDDTLHDGLTEDAHLYHEQIKLAYAQLHVASLASVSGYLILPVLLWNHVPHFNILLWLGLCIVSVLIAPHILLSRYWRSDEQTRKKPYWSNWLVGIAFIGSCSWGSLGILLYPPESLVFQFVLMFFISVGAAVATIVGASYQPLFWAKFLPNILPFSIYVLFQNDAMHTLMGLGIPFFYGTALLVLYRNLHKHLLESLRLRREKNHLIGQLQLEKQAAEKANAEKSRFLAAASHDLRQPLYAQMLLLDDLKAQAQTPHGAQIIRQLETSMGAMNGLFNELLDISKLDACAITPVISEFQVNDLFKELEMDFAKIAASKNLRFRIHTGALSVRSDRSLLSRILRNLVSNAIRYTDQGGILIGCRRRGGQVLIQVWDTGYGIPAEEHEHIFAEFYQLNNPERDRNKGLGLGLAIVARLAELLNHQILIDSHLKKGSVFSIRVPVAKSASATANRPPVPVAQNIAGLNVLLVEDDELILAAMRDLFARWGCNVFAASSLETAVGHLGSVVDRLDLIVADYRLRNHITGIEVIDRLEKVLNRKIPAIIVTGDTSPQILQTILQSGRYALHKPVAPQILRACIDEVLASRSCPMQTEK